MATEAQRKLASAALLLAALVGTILVALSGRSQYVGGLTFSTPSLSFHTRNRGSLGSIGSLYSIGSVGSAFSIGSVGSAFSIGSIFGLGTACAAISAMSLGGCLVNGYVGLPYGLGQLISAARRRKVR